MVIMDRRFLVLIALWALLAMPALCTAEFLAHHPCGCEAGSECADGDDCTDDSCHDTVFSVRQVRERGGATVDVTLPDGGIPAVAMRAPLLLAPDVCSTADSPPRANSPFAESRMPLLE